MSSYDCDVRILNGNYVCRQHYSMNNRLLVLVIGTCSRNVNLLGNNAVSYAKMEPKHFSAASCASTRFTQILLSPLSKLL